MPAAGSHHGDMPLLAHKDYMRNLIEFLTKYNHWFLFILLEVISMVLLFQGNSYQGSVWFSSANILAGKIYEWNADLDQFFSLSAVNEQLTQRNVFLEREVEDLNERLMKATKDTTAMKHNQFALLNSYKLIPAKVVDNSINKLDNFITIDKGSLDGIHKDMGVVSGTGVVGIIYLVGLHYSVVIPVLNSQSNISVSIQGRGYFGYLHWRGGSSRHAWVDDVPRHAKFRLYDKVVTSGYSSVFPPGVMVGKILHVYNSPDGLSYRMMVELATDFGDLRDVCVIDDAMMKERIQIMRAAEDSIKPKEEGEENN